MDLSMIAAVELTYTTLESLDYASAGKWRLTADTALRLSA